MVLSLQLPSVLFPILDRPPHYLGASGILASVFLAAGSPRCRVLPVRLRLNPGPRVSPVNESTVPFRRRHQKSFTA